MSPVQLITGLPSLKPRPADSHKGLFGRVLVVAGSRGMSGAAILAGVAALRGGAGLVTVAVPEGIQPIVAAAEPALMTVGLSETSRGQLSIRAVRQIRDLASEATVVACGPGWRSSSSTRAIAVELYRHAPVTVVLDADALNVLAGDFRAGPFPAPGPRVLTPHPGEFSRLTGLDAPAIQAGREKRAAEFALRHGVVVLLKGRQTVISDGSRVAINATGNPGLATGGSGDVLTGLLAAFIGQGLPAFEAAQLAAHVHGLAADMVADELSQPGLIASDLPLAIAKVLADSESPAGGHVR